jgi:hypothetical protein
MKKSLVAAAVLVVAGLAVAAMAQAPEGPKPKKFSIVGQIVAVGDDGKITVHVSNKDGAKDLVIATDANTKVSIGKTSAKVSDLKPKLYIHIIIVGDMDKPAEQMHAQVEPPKHGRGDAPPASAPASAPHD